jgi:hypothetical protein
VGPQLAQVVAQLAEPVVGLGQPVPGQQARMHLAGRPVGDEGAGVQQPLHEADHAIAF